MRGTSLDERSNHIDVVFWETISDEDDAACPAKRALSLIPNASDVRVTVVLTVGWCDENRSERRLTIQAARALRILVFQVTKEPMPDGRRSVTLGRPPNVE